MSDYVPKTKDFTNAPLCLSGHGVTKVFGLGEKKTVAVDHVDFDFHEGEFVSIVGESGSGKTTLSKMLLGLLNQTEGGDPVPGQAPGRFLPQKEKGILERHSGHFPGSLLFLQYLQ